MALAGCSSKPVSPAPGPAAAPAPSSPSTAPGVPSLVTSASVALSPAGATHLSDVNQVNAALDVTGLDGAGQQGLVEFTMPSGMSYQQLNQTFTASALQTQHLTFKLPVAGTFITSNNISGTWTAHFLVNGKEVATQPFVLPQ